MGDYRDLDWEMFTGHMFSKKELDEIYEQGIADERERIVRELGNRIAEETLGRNVSDIGIGLKIALKIVRGGE